jgi:hypothetical protein
VEAERNSKATDDGRRRTERICGRPSPASRPMEKK